MHILLLAQGGIHFPVKCQSKVKKFLVDKDLHFCGLSICQMDNMLNGMQSAWMVSYIKGIGQNNVNDVAGASRRVVLLIITINCICGL